MASTPEPVAEQSAQLPDADNAALPGHLLRTLEWRTGMEYVSARLAMRRIAGWPHGDGHPVLVLPGFLAGPLSTDLLRNVLRQLDYRVYDWGLGTNMGYRASMKETLPARLHHIRERADGRRVSLIGWSAGGIYARELARAPARRCPVGDHPGVTVSGQPPGHHRVEGVALGQPWHGRHRGRLRTGVNAARPTAVGADDLHLQQVGRHRGLAVLHQRAGAPDRKHRSPQQPLGIRAQRANAVGDRRPARSARRRLATLSAIVTRPPFPDRDRRDGWTNRRHSSTSGRRGVRRCAIPSRCGAAGPSSPSRSRSPAHRERR